MQQLTPKFENFTNSDSLSLCVTFPLLEDCSGLLNTHNKVFISYVFYQSNGDSCFNAWTVVNYTFALTSAPLILWYWLPDLNITIDKMYKLLCWCSPQFNSTCIYHKALFDVDTKAKFSYTWTQQIKKSFFLHIKK